MLLHHKNKYDFKYSLYPVFMISGTHYIIVLYTSLHDIMGFTRYHDIMDLGFDIMDLGFDVGHSAEALDPLAAFLKELQDLDSMSCPDLMAALADLPIP